MADEPGWRVRPGAAAGAVLILGPHGRAWDRVSLLADALVAAGAAVRAPGESRVDIETVLRETPPVPGPRAVLVSAPTEQAVRRVGSARLTGWATLLDVDRPWPAVSPRGMPGWYHESFLGHLARHVDVVSVCSPGLADFLRTRYGVEPVVVPNGCPPLPPSGPTGPGADTAGPRAVLGVPVPVDTMGFHWDTVIKVANALAQQDPTAVVEVPAEPPTHLSVPDSVRCVGELGPHELAGAARRWRAALLPLRPGTATTCADPVEVYACQAWGVPVVAPLVPALLGRPGVHLADNPDDLLALTVAVWQTARTDTPAPAPGFDPAATQLLDLARKVQSGAWLGTPEMLPGWTPTGQPLARAAQVDR